MIWGSQRMFSLHKHLADLTVVSLMPVLHWFSSTELSGIKLLIPTSIIWNRIKFYTVIRCLFKFICSIQFCDYKWISLGTSMWFWTGTIWRPHLTPVVSASVHVCLVAESACLSYCPPLKCQFESCSGLWCQTPAFSYRLPLTLFPQVVHQQHYISAWKTLLSCSYLRKVTAKLPMSTVLFLQLLFSHSLLSVNQNRIYLTVPNACTNHLLWVGFGYICWWVWRDIRSVLGDTAYFLAIEQWEK